MPYRRNNYDFVIDSSFQPFSMNEMLTPFMQYKDAYEKAEAQSILNQNEVPRPIDESIGHSYWVCVAKNKEGLIGDVDIKFDGDHQRFIEYERRYE